MAFLGFWIREIIGWILVFAGLLIFYLCLTLLLHPAPRIIEAGPLVVIGVVVFRGGIHLLKVAVAARISLRVRREVRKQSSLPKAKRQEVTPLSGGALMD